MNKFILFIATTVMTLIMGMTAFAGQWIQETDKPENENSVSNWKYQKDDGTYIKNAWEWIDRGDGFGECYCFNEEGYIYVSKVIIESGVEFRVNEEGKFCRDDGIVVTKPLNVQNQTTEEENAASAMMRAKGQWTTEGNHKKYTYSDGSFAKDQWKGIDGFIYHFDSDGYMEVLKTVHEDMATSYYLNEDGKLYNVTARDGYVAMNTYRSEQPGTTYDAQYPLKGLLTEYGLEYQPVVYDEVSGSFSVREVDASYYDKKYTNSNTGCIQEYAYALSGNITDYHRIKNFLTLGYSGTTSPYIESSESKYPEVEKVISEIRSFLNSFDFINASETEKAQKVVEYVSRASYDYETAEDGNKGNRGYSDHWRSASIYGCLIDKSCVCQGYSDAFHTLARMVGLLCVTTNNSDHQWDYVRIDGEWWMHSNGKLYRPGTTITINGNTIPAFEQSSFATGYAETYSMHPKHWAYLP